MARTAPSSPTRNRYPCRPTAAPGTPWAMSSGTPGALAEDELLGRDVERPLVALGVLGRRERRPIRGGVEARRADRAADAEARDGGVAPRRPPGRRQQAGLRAPRRCRRAPRGRRWRGPTRGRRPPRPGRRGRRTASAPTDDRHGVARAETRLLVGLPSVGRGGRRSGSPPAENAGRIAGPSGDRDVAVGLGHVNRLPVRTRSPGGAPSTPTAALVEPGRRVPAGAAREDPDARRSRPAPGSRPPAPRGSRPAGPASSSSRTSSSGSTRTARSGAARRA